jgi:hypothetical protein
MAEPVLHEVISITLTQEADCLIMRIDRTDIYGLRDVIDYCTRPGDPFGLNPELQQWLEDNPGFPRQPYVPPTTEELRVSMPNLTARQLRLGLIGNGIMPSQVDAALNAMPAGAAKEMALVEWDYASNFRRLHPLIASVGAALKLSDAQIDAMWAAAATL